MKNSVPKRSRGPLSAALVFSLCWWVRAAAAPVLELLPPSAPSLPVRVAGSGAAGSLLRLETSALLAGGWQEAGRFHDLLYPWPDGGSAGAGRRYYRLMESPRKAEDDWKYQIVTNGEAFRAAGSAEALRWVKFALNPAEPWRVYFQDSAKYPFHYEFATQRLAPFAGMTREAFDGVTLHTASQQLVLGTVLFPPRSTSSSTSRRARSVPRMARSC